MKSQVLIRNQKLWLKIPKLLQSAKDRKVIKILQVRSKSSLTMGSFNLKEPIEKTGAPFSKDKKEN